jgi:hypothetical protein
MVRLHNLNPESNTQNDTGTDEDAYGTSLRRRFLSVMRQLTVPALILAIANISMGGTIPMDDSLYPVVTESVVIQGVEVPHYGFIDRLGKLVIPGDYAHADIFSDGYAKVDFHFNHVVSMSIPAEERTRPKQRLVNLRGEVTGPYRSVSRFSEGYAVLVSTDGKPVLIDTSLKVISKGDYRVIQGFSEGLCLALRKMSDHIDRWVFMDTAENVVFELPQLMPDGSAAQQIGLFKGGLVRVRSSTGLWGYIDREGREVVAPLYREATDFQEGLALVRRADLKYIFIDAQGRQAFPGEFEFSFPFSEGLAAVNAPVSPGSKESRFGYVDPKGQWVIAPQFDRAMPFSEGLAMVGQRENDGFTYHFIDAKGRKAFHRTFVSPTTFHHGFSSVVFQEGKKQTRAVIDRTGKIVWKTPPPKE